MASFTEDEINYLIDTEPNLCGALKRKQKNIKFKNFVVRDTNDAKADVMFANIKSNQVAIKLWLTWDQVNESDVPENLRPTVTEFLDNANNFGSLSYEAAMYKYITNNIIKKNLSNNFVPLVSEGTCSLQKILPMVQGMQSLSDKIKKYTEIPNLKLKYFITGSSSHLENFRTFLQRHPDENNLKTILLQLLHALYILEKFKINQNDLHLDNILIETLDKPMRVRLAGIELKTQYVPKIFDFDLGFCKKVLKGDNPVLRSDFLNIHIGNRFRRNVEYFQLLCSLFKYEEYIPIVKAFLPNKNFLFSDVKGISSKKTLNEEIFSSIVNFLKKNSNTYIFQFQQKAEKLYANFPRDLYEELRKQCLNFPAEVTTLYFALNLREKSIEFFKGHFCYPIFDPSDQMLVPLKDIFKNKKFSNAFLS